MRRFSEEGEVLGVDLPEVDIAVTRDVTDAVAAMRPDLIINAAAFTDVEAAEEHQADAFRVNEAGAACVAQAAMAANAKVVYYSTDFVFSGDRYEPYGPDDACAPLSVYGRSKRAGEEATRAAAPRHFIIRTAWLYGPGGNNFVEKILRAAQTRPSLTVVEDEIGSPTCTRDLAEATVALCCTDAFGTYHAVNAGACSRREFANAIVKAADIDIEVHGCSSKEFQMKAQRPKYSVLSNEKLEHATGFAMRAWQVALKDYVQNQRGTV